MVADLPAELLAAPDAEPAARKVWSSLDDDDRAGLAAFVADGWLRQTRSRRAEVVAAKCDGGETALNDWMWMNRMLGASARFAGDGPPPAA